MDPELTEEQRIFKEQIRKFVDAEIRPLVDEAEEKQEFPVELFRKAGRLGYLGMRYPQEYGGANADKVTECIFVEELHRACSGIASVLLAGSLACDPIFYAGREDQKRKYLAAVVKGEKIGAFAMTEPNAGSDVSAMESKAVKQGDHYVINGTKLFITAGPICDFCVVAAYTDPSKKYKGMSLFIVDRDTPGFIISRKLDKVGNRSAETGELVFDDCLVPAKNLVGEKEGEGFAQLMKTLSSGRIIFGARCVGLAQEAFDLSLKYSRERIQFRRPIGQFQVNRFKLARMAMHIDVMRTITYRAARLLDKLGDCLKEASMVKLFCTELLQQIVADAMQLHGGYGYMMEFPIQRIWRDARLYTITEGTSEIQHQIIAREMGF
jgi:acyl-CoA dehydrogenase